MIASMEYERKRKKCDKERDFHVGVSEEWTKIPGGNGAQQAKIAKIRLSKHLTECDKGMDKSS